MCYLSISVDPPPPTPHPHTHGRHPHHTSPPKSLPFIPFLPQPWMKWCWRRGVITNACDILLFFFFFKFLFVLFHLLSLSLPPPQPPGGPISMLPGVIFTLKTSLSLSFFFFLNMTEMRFAWQRGLHPCGVVIGHVVWDNSIHHCLCCLFLLFAPPLPTSTSPPPHPSNPQPPRSRALS